MRTGHDLGVWRSSMSKVYQAALVGIEGLYVSLIVGRFLAHFV